ncbi:ABC transporter permease [Lacticaseibacillus kribbianus]|uniref:ABC transporter permease n=1 Tax=Lacticaseibacillus kribbianus TaxID=2926292 RepID=UPI001CD223B6|nr:ABC transporter permease [Lacticaseibacillus kribbianus]
MRHAWFIARRVIAELLRDKRTLALMFVAPVLIMFLMKLVFTANSTTGVTVATVGLPTNVRTALNDVKHVTVVKRGTEQAAKRALADQKVDAYIEKTAANRYRVTYANTDATKTALVKAGFGAALTAAGVKTLQQTVTKMGKTITVMSATIKKLSAAQAVAAAKAAGAAGGSAAAGTGATSGAAGTAGSSATTEAASDSTAAGDSAGAATSDTTATTKASTGKAAKVKVTNRYRYGNKDTGFFDKIVPILMGFFVFFFVFLISGMALLKERTTGTLDRLLATPVRRGEIVAGYMLSYGVLAIIQTVIIVLTTVGFMNVEITGSLFAVMVINFLLALVALAFGILMSTFAQSEFQMMQFIPIIVIPQVFFSGIVPLDSLADWVKNISYVLPLTYAGNAMTQVIMHGKGLLSLGLDIAVLLLFLAVLSALNVRGMRRYRKV